MPKVIKCETSIQALECIDEIHEESHDNLKMGLPMLKNELEHWGRVNYLPCQMDSIMNLAI